MRERRGEQQVQSLVGRRQPAHDVADVGDEAEVEHAVGLVEDQHLDRAQVEHALLVEVDEAPRGADQDVDALFQDVALLVVVDAAEGEPERQPGVLPEDLGVVVDLHGELARRRDDQGPGRIDLPVGRNLAPHERRVHRDEECGRLAGARLGLPGDVHSRECPRQRLRLDRGAALEAGIGYAAGESVWQVEIRERNVGQVCVGHLRSWCMRPCKLGKSGVKYP